MLALIACFVILAGIAVVAGLDAGASWGGSGGGFSPIRGRSFHKQSVGRGWLARGQPMPWVATRRHRAVGNRALPLRLRPEVRTLDNVVGQP